MTVSFGCTNSGIGGTVEVVVVSTVVPVVVIGALVVVDAAVVVVDVAAVVVDVAVVVVDVATVVVDGPVVEAVSVVVVVVVVVGRVTGSVDGGPVVTGGGTEGSAIPPMTKETQSLNGLLRLILTLSTTIGLPRTDLTTWYARTRRATHVPR